MFTDRMFIPCYGPIYSVRLAHHLFCVKVKAPPFIKVITAASERQRVWILTSTENSNIIISPVLWESKSDIPGSNYMFFNKTSHGKIWQHWCQTFPLTTVKGVPLYIWILYIKSLSHYLLNPNSSNQEPCYYFWY